MLDYDLVTAKAAYRILKPDDCAAFVEMVLRFHGETGTPGTISREGVLVTVRELDRHKRSGSIFVIQRGQALVGYCIIINRWCNELGGNILCLDELYVSPEHRRLGIATDFVELLAKIAPRESVAMQVGIVSTNRKATGLLRRLGFVESRSKVMTRELGERA